MEKENGFSELENPEKSFDDGGYLERVGKERINALKDFIEELEILVEERAALSKIITEEAEKMKIEIRNFLATNKAYDSEGFKERSGLRQKLVEISELELNEKVNCWRDVAVLKKELRERKREYTEKKERLEMLGQFVG